MNIYIHKEGTNYGPYSIEQVKEYVLQGSFTLQDNACHDGQNWIPVAQLPGMAPVSPSPAPQSSNAPTQSTTEKKQTGAGKSETVETMQSTASTTQNSEQAGSESKKSGGSKKWILFSGIGAAAIIAITGICWWIFSGDEEINVKENQVADIDTAEEESYLPGETVSEDSTANSETVSLPTTPLVERIPSEAGAVILVRIDHLLEKGREDIAALFSPGLPMVVKALEDPSSLGLDVSTPLQIHINPNENPEIPPSGGLAAKLSDREKFKSTLELLGGLEKPTDKDGYQLYVTPSQDGRGDVQIAIGTDFLYMNVGNPAKPDEVKQAIEQFMTTDGSAGLLSSEDSFSEFIKKEDDLVMWFGGNSIYETLDANMQDAVFAKLKGGHGNITLNFEKGEMVAAMEFQAPHEEMVYGNGSFSDEILSFAPADPIFSLGFAMKLEKFTEFFEKEILGELGVELKLDEAMPELGNLTIRDAINAFTGELMISMTDLTMPDNGAGGGLPPGLPMDESMNKDPFSDPEMEDGDLSFPAPGNGGELPAAGAPPGMNPGAMMMAAMPKPEFIIAASIDTEKWLKLKSAPPLAMGLGLAMMQGISIIEKNDFLVIASKEHIGATQSGSVKNPISGPERKIFESNDFVWRINVAPIMNLDLPIPPGEATELIRGISHLEISSSNASTSGKSEMKLVFADQQQNSLSYIFKLVNAVQSISRLGKNEFEDMEKDFEFE